MYKGPVDLTEHVGSSGTVGAGSHRRTCWTPDSLHNLENFNLDGPIRANRFADSAICVNP